MCEIDNLIQFWRRLPEGATVHPDDKVLIDDKFIERYGRRLGSRSDLSAADKFFDQRVGNKKTLPIDDKPHFDLTPVPYTGDLKSADIFLLMVNPVLGYADYGSDGCPEFQKALRNNIDQKDNTSCLALDTRFWWSSWFNYYERLLRPTIREYSEKTETTYLEALNRFSARLAIIELAPYYSADSSWLTPRAKKLPSAKMAQAAAKQLAQNKEVLVVVRWGREKWDLKSKKCCYIKAGKSRNDFKMGQKAIVKRLMQEEAS
jgi:hypothetical protein